MAKNDNALEKHLSRDNEITISVTGRKSGRTIKLPIWFVWEDETLYVLPVKGSDTQWYKNVLKNPSVRIAAGGAHSEVRLAPITDATLVKSVIEKFRGKYGAGDVKKYYSKFDVAARAQMS